jgi:hypothetical protein
VLQPIRQKKGALLGKVALIEHQQELAPILSERLDRVRGPAVNSHRSPGSTSSTNIALSEVNKVTRALPVSISAHSSARCQCSSRKLPLVSRILTPAISFDTGSSRVVTWWVQPSS